MKPSAQPCKIKAIHLGEAQLNLIRVDQPPIRAKYALLTEDGDACGYYEKVMGWSDATLEALRKFAEALETEAMGAIFVQPEEAAAPEAGPVDETPQF